MVDKNAPCKDCPERFLACSDKCPKDARGEYGYKTWLADVHKQQAAYKEYKARRREDYLHSEQCQTNRKNYSNSKTRRRRGKDHGR